MERFIDAVPIALKHPIVFLLAPVFLIPALLLWRQAGREQARLERIRSEPKERQADALRIETGKSLPPGKTADEALANRQKVAYWTRWSGGLSFAAQCVEIAIYLAALAYGGDDRPGPTCVEEECNGQDPARTGCALAAGAADQVDIKDDQGQVVGWVRLRYSELCRTNWAQGENTSNRRDLLTRVYLRDEAGNEIPVTAAESSGLGIFGNMWWAPNGGAIRTRACVVIGDYNEACTGAY